MGLFKSKEERRIDELILVAATAGADAELAAGVERGRVIAEAVNMARELCAYGQRLSPRFQYAAEPPFEDQYRDYGIYLSVLAGEQVEEGLSHFRAKAESADPETVGTFPAEVLVNLLVRIDRPAEALDISRRYLARPQSSPPSCPSIVELCRQTENYKVLAEVAREQGDLRRAEKLLREAAKIYGQVGSRAMLALAEAWLATVLAELGKIDEGEVVALRARSTPTEDPEWQVFTRVLAAAPRHWLWRPLLLRMDPRP